MTSGRRPPRVELIGLLFGALSTALATVATLTSLSRNIIFYAIALSVTTMAVLAYYYLLIARRLPVSLSVALIGPPGVGKTVYLTLLFRELETGRVGPLLFAPSGSHTTAEVAQNIALMASGRFPPATPPGQILFYEAVAQLGRLLRKQFRIRIGDFAGEHLFAKPTDEWFKYSDLHEYLGSVDAVIFMIDCNTLLDKAETEKVSYIENSFIALLNGFIEKRNENPMDPLRIPVALLFSKADLVWGTEKPGEAEVVARLANFIAVCSRRCRRFSYFFVSALGQSPENPGVPPRRIRPRGIVEPLEWILRA